MNARPRFRPILSWYAGLMQAGSIDQVASEFGITRRTLYRLISQHHIRTYKKVGDRRTYVNREDVRPLLGLQPRQELAQELVALYSHRADVPNGLWWDLITQAEDQIDILVYAAPFLHEQHPEMNSVLMNKGEVGCQIRVALGDPDSDAVRQRGEEERYGEGILDRCRLALRNYSPVIGAPNVQVRVHQTTLYNSIYRFDDQMLINMHIWGSNAYAAPVLHLKHMNEGSLFDSYAHSFDAVWATAAIVKQVGESI